MSAFACPFCTHLQNVVVESRYGTRGEFIRRRRECDKCHRRFTTYEYAEDAMPVVVKRDGRQEPFDHLKLRRSIERAAPGGTVVEAIVAAVERSCGGPAERRVETTAIADLIGAELRRVAPVAYLRWISAAKHFTEPRQFMVEAALMDVRRR